MIKKISSSSILTLLLAVMLNMPAELKSQARDFNTPSRTKPSKANDFKFDASKLVVGGNLGASFGSITYAELAPTIGYLFRENYLAGFTAKYIYYEDNGFKPVYLSHIYGGGLYNQYFFLENFLAHGELEYLHRRDRQGSAQRSFDIFSVLVGGGYRSFLGGNSYFSFLLLYNLNDGPHSPYSNPILRVGLGIGL